MDHLDRLNQKKTYVTISQSLDLNLSAKVWARALIVPFHVYCSILPDTLVCLVVLKVR